MARIELTDNGHTVVGSRYYRGSSPQSGGRQNVGYRLTCTCGWTTRINAPKRDAEPYAKDHLKYDHEPEWEPQGQGEADGAPT